MADNINTKSAVSSLAKFKEKNKEDRSLLEIYAPSKTNETISGPLALVENVRTTLAKNRAQGSLDRRLAEVQSGYLSKTHEIAERLKHDVRSQKMLNESQRIGGILETESLRAAAQIDSEQKMTTITAIQESSQLETKEKAHIANQSKQGELTDEQAAELEALHEYLGQESKRDALERHDRIRNRRQHQFEHASAIKTHSPSEWE